MNVIQRVRGRAIVLPGDDIDTDRIMPARFLKAVTFAGLEAHVFADDRAEAARAGAVHPFDNPSRGGAALLFVGANFGCGSSREHAPQGLYRRGIRAIVAHSFADIFRANAQAIGLVCAAAADGVLHRARQLAAAAPESEFEVDLTVCRLRAAAIDEPLDVSPSAQAAFLTGTWDATSMLLDRYEEVERVARALPY